LRVAVRGAIRSPAKRWLLGATITATAATLAIATEMAFAFPSLEPLRAGIFNRLVDPDALVPPRVRWRHTMTLLRHRRTLAMMRAMRPRVADEFENLAARLKDHGAKEDLMESRKAFAEKRPPRFKGWDHPEDRQRTPKLQSVGK
jgi:hypothetical protein